jgi:CBS domain-containing protein
MATGVGRFQDVPVEKVMTRNPATIEPEATLSDAAEIIVQGGFRHLPVVDGAGRLVGMLSERDLRTRLGIDLRQYSEATLEALSEPVSSAMSPDPISIGARTQLAEALEIFADEKVGALAVVDESERLKGILSYVDLLAYLRERGGGPPARRPEPEEFGLPGEEAPASWEEPVRATRPPARKPRAKRTVARKLAPRKRKGGARKAASKRRRR